MQNPIIVALDDSVSAEVVRDYFRDYLRIAAEGWERFTVRAPADLAAAGGVTASFSPTTTVLSVIRSTPPVAAVSTSGSRTAVS